MIRDVCSAMRFRPGSARSTRLPRVTFTDPEIGAVGLTAAQARDRFGPGVRVVTAPLAEAAARGWIHGPGNDGVLVLVEHDGVLLGATSAGPAGGEILGALSVAVQARVPVLDLARQVWAYPTLHRGIEHLLAELRLTQRRSFAPSHRPCGPGPWQARRVPELPEVESLATFLREHAGRPGRRAGRRGRDQRAEDLRPAVRRWPG